MNIANARKQRINDVFNDQSTNKSESSISNEIANLSIYDISLYLQEAWDAQDPDEIISSFQNIKHSCNDPDQLISTEQFYPVIFPILISTLHEPNKYPESFPIGPIIIESLSILCDISSLVSIENQYLRNIIKDLYSLLFNEDHHAHIFNSDFQLDDQLFFEFILKILINFIQRGGIYAFSVADLFHSLDFIPFLSSIPQCPAQHAAVVFITTFQDLKMVATQDVKSKFVDLIQQADFTDSDKLHLISWLFDLIPTSFEEFDHNFLYQFLYFTICREIDQEPEDVENNHNAALICLATILNHSKDIGLFESRELHEFNYTPIFDVLMNSDNQKEFSEIIFGSSLRCIVEIADIGIEGQRFLASSIDIYLLLHNTFTNYHSIQTKKYAVKLIKKFAKHSRNLYASLFLDEDIISTLISLLDADDDVSLIKDIFKFFNFIIGDISNQDELSENFYSIFLQNEGWDAVTDLMFKCVNAKVANYATNFYQRNYNEPMDDDDDLTGLM